MNIHEYQAKKLLAEHGVMTLPGQVAFSVDEAVTAAEKMGGHLWVVKSQIHAGGRGAGHFKDDAQGGGGVRIATSLGDVKTHAQAMLGNILVTKQTGPAGKQVKRLFVEQGCDIDRELYLSLVLDRTTSTITVIASGDGGMNIETLAEEQPEKVATIHINPASG
ncbi:MAG: ATP-grasp domain-containing protein, partial [Pseudomonadota bacterium]